MKTFSDLLLGCSWHVCGTNLYTLFDARRADPFVLDADEVHAGPMRLGFVYVHPDIARPSSPDRWDTAIVGSMAHPRDVAYYRSITPGCRVYRLHSEAVVHQLLLRIPATARILFRSTNSRPLPLP